MGRALDLVAAALLLGAAFAFSMGVRSLDHEEDRFALYWLLVGGFSLKASVDLLHPRRAR